MNNYFKSKDLYESAAIYASDIPLITIEREGKLCWFIFENPKLCKEISDSYWRGSLILNSKKLVDSIKTLKDRVFAQK